MHNESRPSFIGLIGGEGARVPTDWSMLLKIVEFEVVIRKEPVGMPSRNPVLRGRRRVLARTVQVEVRVVVVPLQELSNARRTSSGGTAANPVHVDL
jgi:hypothetical protein